MNTNYEQQQDSQQIRGMDVADGTSLPQRFPFTHHNVMGSAIPAQQKPQQQPEPFQNGKDLRSPQVCVPLTN